MSTSMHIDTSTWTEAMKRPRRGTRELVAIGRVLVVL